VKKTLVFGAFVCLLFSAYLHADVSGVQVVGKELDAHITVASAYQADLKIIFENVTGLDVNALTITAIQPNLNDVIARLSDPSLISLPAQFPVLITITPPPGSALAFTGIVTIDLDTSNLSFSPSFRLFTAPSGVGIFDDITNFSGVGSYRVHGTGGGFSDFLILTDLRDPSSVINSKFGKLQDTLNTNASLISPAMLQNLQTKYNAALAAYQAGAKDQAVTNLNAFIDLIKTDNGASMPNIYRANSPTTKNVAGELRRRADTLVFSLRL